MYAVSAAHAVDLAAIGARRCRIGQGFRAPRTIGRPYLVDLLTLWADRFLGHAPVFKISLDLAGGEVSVLHILRQIDLDELVKPAVFGRHRRRSVVQLLVEFSRRVKTLDRKSV